VTNHEHTIYSLCAITISENSNDMIWLSQSFDFDFSHIYFKDSEKWLESYRTVGWLHCCFGD